MKVNLQEKSAQASAMKLFNKTAQLLKAQKLILALFIGLMAHTEVSAHASTITRKWCGGFFHRKFVAKAQTSVLSYTKYQTGYNCIGQYVGTANIGYWSSNCSNESKGCSRPQVATCTKSGTVYDQIYSGCYLTFTGPSPYSANAKAQHLTSGIYLTQTTTGRGSAGLSGNFALDPNKFSKLVDDGTSFSEIKGDVDINDNNQLVISNLNGRLSVTKGADYYSNIKIVVIKEKENITDDEALQNEEAVQNGTYPDVVYSTQLNVSKNGLTHDGVFSKGVAAQQIKEYAANQEYGVNINNFSMTIPTGAQLNPDEKLTVVTVVDGGFDISTAVVTKGTGNVTAANTAVVEAPQLHPNPATDYVDVYVNLPKKELVNVRVISTLGRVAIERSENLNSGRQSIKLNTQKLLPGSYIVEIKSESKISSQKLLIK
ncbi:hypothetical protein M2347_003821 [Chryseobacterium sp. H1D6B]|uniref:T9SS type A sorting domain-containing protein n=1 Tax=Chryseobacterium sp. H1D6B TaxID=2940588 RepID=UPI0015CBEC93|nr:T9SS type A sorting domain-containing protein [Chryseobacterium sp. H1D6B]MDH6254094.1 hypothetical protein [Chryseobacterium sp. H1D6B]